MSDPTSSLPSKNDHEYFEILMMGYLDGELTSDLERAFREHLESCQDCTREIVRYREIADIAKSVRLKEPQDYELERFWQDIYNRMERRSGWTLVGIGGVLFAAIVAMEIALTNLLSWWVKVGVGALALGFVLLFLSVLRARLRALPYDRYREVQR